MRRALTTALVALVSTVLVVGVSAGPAAAQTRTFKDPRGDAKARVDITSYKVTSRAGSHTVTVKLRRYKPSRTAVGFIVASPDQTRGYAVVAFAKGAEVARYSKAQRKYVPSTCSGIKVKRDPGRNGSVRIKVPRRCIKQVRTSKSFTAALAQDTRLKRVSDQTRPRPVRRG